MSLYWDFSGCKPQENPYVREHMKGLYLDISEIDAGESLFIIDDLIKLISVEMNKQGVWYSDDELSLLARSLMDWADNPPPPLNMMAS